MTAKTYLELCQDVCRECDIGAGESAIGAVTGQVGELDRVVKWVRDAWREIQQSHSTWRFMRGTFTLNTVASDDEYAYTDCTDTETSSAISRFSDWRFRDNWDQAKIYLQSAGVGGERWLTYTPWEAFKSIYKLSSQNNGPPQHITIDPEDNLVLGPAPDAVYVVTGDYYKSVQILAANSDEPDCPFEYHDLIMYRAMMKYANFEVAPEIMNQAEFGASPIWDMMLKKQLPDFRFAGPLA